MGQIPGVPGKITLSQVQTLLDDLGFSRVTVDDLVSLTISVDEVEAEVYATDEEGRHYVTPDGERAATHRLAIRLDRDN